MGDEYLSRILLEVNGQNIDDFDQWTEKEIELHRPVNLMNKTGFMKATPRYAFDLVYVKPATGEFDWTTVENGRATVEFENGERIIYTGVSVLKLNDMTVDGENAAKRTIECGATGRVKE